MFAYDKKDFSNYKKEVDIKLNNIKKYFIELINLYNPTLIVIEGVQFQSNAFTFAQLARLQGLLIDTCIEKQLLYQIVPPSTWRMIGVKGRKRAEQKQSSIQFVKNTFNIDVDDDIADAINMGYYATKFIQIKGDK